MDPFEGRVALNYQIIGKIGQGAFGSVYRARHMELGREVAIKILLPQHAAKPDLIERFIREARVVCDIGHEDIVAVENAGRLDTGEPFYMMELVEGRSLARVVAEDGPLSAQRFARVFAPLASALAAAHDKKVVHRDLKPQNVMVREREGEILGVKLLDFGIAKFLHEVDGDSHTGDALGTPHYMAPEQVSDAKHVDARADVYAFAGTAFFALSGQRPVAGTTVTQVLHNVVMREATRLLLVAPAWGPELSEALAQCMAKDPAARPRGVREAWALVQQAVSRRPMVQAALGATMTADSRIGALTPTQPPPTPEDPSSMSMRTPTLAGSLPATRTPPSRPRRRWLTMTAIAAAAAGLVVLTWLTAERAARLNDGPSLAAPAAADAAPARTPATPVQVVAAPPDAAPLPPDAALVVVAVVPPDAGTAVTRPPRHHASKKPEPGKNQPDPVATVAPPAPAPAPVIPASSCTKERFAAVYRQESPSSKDVNDALRVLLLCFQAGHINHDDYSRIQAALIAK